MAEYYPTINQTKTTVILLLKETHVNKFALHAALLKNVFTTCNITAKTKRNTSGDKLNIYMFIISQSFFKKLWYPHMCMLQCKNAICTFFCVLIYFCWIISVSVFTALLCYFFLGPFIYSVLKTQNEKQQTYKLCLPPILTFFENNKKLTFCKIYLL